MLKAAGWTQVDPNDKQPGDVINDLTVHVMIYAGDGKIWDQHCGVVSSSGQAPITGGPFASSYASRTDVQVWRAPGK